MREMLTITYERVFPSGAWECSTLYKGYWRHMQYMGCGIREAQRMFRAWLLTIKEGE